MHESNTTEDSKNFIGFEYKTINPPRNLASLYIDYLPSFGWEIEDSSVSGGSTANLAFKRNRKLKNKVEISKLQRQFESGIESLVSLEKSKTTLAVIVALIIGIIGTAFMAGSVFAITSGNIAGCIILAIPGFIGWILPFFVYRTITKKQSAKIASQIDRQYDDLFATCEKSMTLLA